VILDVILGMALATHEVPIPQIHGPNMICAPASMMIATILRSEEVKIYEGYIEKGTVPFEFYVNTEKGTSSFVIYPVQGMACITAGVKVKFADRPGDL
jgi:hypothetical protein